MNKYKYSISFVALVLLCVKGCSGQSNRAPVFAANSQSSFEVNENTPAGRVLTTLTATDPENNPITFSINTKDFFGIRQINANTVEVRHTSNIDYERNSEVRFKVTARDDVSNSKTDHEIIVTVKDLNDNGPVFVGDRSFTLPEDTTVGHVIEDAFMITDRDTGVNAELTVSCLIDINNTQTKEACDTFSVNSTRKSNGKYSIHIKLIKKLDYEKVKDYIMAVQAIDAAPPRNKDSRNVVIKILDSQDQPPVFIGAPYSFYPHEEKPIGFEIDKLRVYDGDRDATPERRLKLELLNDTRNWLELSPLTNSSGVFTSSLKVKNRMDREEYYNNSIYTVAIKLSELKADGSVDPDAVTNSHITINLLDINDNGPEFYTGLERTPVVKPLVLTIDEGLGVNTPLPGFLLSIMDSDSILNTFNVRMEGIGNDTFQLSPIVGASSVVLSLSVKKEANIDYEKEEYRHMELKIIAEENTPNPKFTNNATVIIKLRDKNDNSPRFKEGIYFAVVSPDNSIGDVIIETEAVDPDSGAYGDITYSLGQYSDLVKIDKKTGIVYLNGSIPSSIDSTEVELVATDGGGRSSTSLLKITIRDEFPEAPVFDNHIYNATVVEDRDVLEKRIIVRATDQDSYTITYRITDGNTPDGVFRLHRTTGRLSLKRPLRKSDGKQFNLTIEASDGELTDTAYIIVDLLDSNDYTPRFITGEYYKTISELTPVGTVLFNITARDADGPDEAGGQLSYTILSGDSTQRFAIDPQTGQLSVNAELDYDSQDLFILQVKAEDHGVPARSAIAFVNITITDENNKLPRFPSDLYVQYMNENDPVGSKVLQLSAYDLDKDSLLRYSIQNDSYRATDPFQRDVLQSANFDFRNAFKINERTGEITTALPFNREAVSFVSFRVTVSDINADKPAVQKGFAEVHITIRQEGIGVPEFLNEPWTPTDQRILVNVTENKYGHVITLVARDSVTHEPITLFRELAGDPENIFTVNDNGQVMLNRPLDYETLIDKTKRLIVEAVTKTGEKSSATLTVTVTNVNDNDPKFAKDEYVFRVVEKNVTRQSIIGSVSATDKDGDVNLRYVITGRDAHLFYIDNQGRIYIKNNTIIDAETSRKYDLFIEVTDRRISGRTTTVPLTINVDNVNEHRPVCVQSPFTYFIPRSISVGSTFGQVLATDKDVKDTVTYFMSENDKFDIDQQTGVLSVVSSTTNADQVTTLSIRARDSGNLYTICQVRVVMTSSDMSNLPIFVNPPDEDTTFNIREGSSINTTITKIEVATPDQKPIDGVRYTLSNHTDISNFRLNRYTGRLYVTRIPDREKKQQYQLIVIAGTNRSQISRKFFVNVTDIDDNFPRFSGCRDLQYPLKLEVIEHQKGGEKVIGTIKACDKDGHPNNKIYYHLVKCINGSTSTESRLFSINDNTGAISVNPEYIDREELPSHELCVNASTSRINAALNADQWKVLVKVKDINDHRVEFKQSTVSAVMSGNSSSGLEVVQILANDKDGSSGSGILYEIVSIEYVKGNQVIKGSDNSTIRDAFMIDPVTGKVTTNLPSYVGFIGGRFNMKIRAKTATDSSLMDLSIFVNNPSEQIIIVFDRSPEEVNKFIKEFFDDLEKLENHKFVVQKITYHTNPISQQTELNKTDVYLYVLDKNGNLVDAATVEEMLKSAYNSERRDELFRKYGVVGDGPRFKALVTRESGSYIDWYGYEWIWWLIIASAIVLIIDALILICCLLYLWNMYIKRPRKYQSQPVYYVR